MRKRLLLVLLILLTADCLSENGTYGYAFTENVPDNTTTSSVSAETLEMPEDLHRALRQAANESETPAFGVPERFSANLTEDEYDALTKKLSGSTPNANYTYITYNDDTLKLYFTTKLIDR